MSDLQSLDLQVLHDLAKIRFVQNPSKCYQGHIREVHGEFEKREQISSLSGGVVERISREDAAAIILKYEWLAADPRKKSPMGAGVQACYGLRLDGELLGALCMGTMGGNIGLICGEEYADRTVCLMRGACVPHAPKNAASFLIRHACRLAFKEFGMQRSTPAVGGWILFCRGDLQTRTIQGVHFPVVTLNTTPLPVAPPPKAVP